VYAEAAVKDNSILRSGPAILMVYAFDRSFRCPE
jgi:hypothetical protein